MTSIQRKQFPEFRFLYFQNLYRKTAFFFSSVIYFNSASFIKLCNSYGAKFQLYVATKKRAKAVKILLPMLRSLTKKWDINSSPLYRHIQTKEVDKSFGSQLQKFHLFICFDRLNERFL